MSKKPPTPDDNLRSDEENKILASLKEKFKGKGIEKLSDLSITRFIRSGIVMVANHDKLKHLTPEQQASNTITRFLEWREKEKVDELVKEHLPYRAELAAQWPCGIHGFDKAGRPVYIDRPCAMDLEALEKKGIPMAKIMKAHIQVMEGVVALHEKRTELSGRLRYKHIFVLDLTGFGLKFAREKYYSPIKTIIDIDQYFYPEILYKMIIVNAPWTVKALWAIVSPWLDEITRSKIVWGSSELEKYIDKDMLPKQLGGTCKCEGGKCFQVPFVSGKGVTLDSYFAQNTSPAAAPAAGAGAGAKDGKEAPAASGAAAPPAAGAGAGAAPAAGAGAGAPQNASAPPASEVVGPAAGTAPAGDAAPSDAPSAPGGPPKTGQTPPNAASILQSGSTPPTTDSALKAGSTPPAASAPLANA